LDKNHAVDRPPARADDGNIRVAVDGVDAGHQVPE